MKIAHVVSLFPPDIGGMGKVAYDEVVELSRRGHEVSVFTLLLDGNNYNDNLSNFTIKRYNPILKSGVAGFIPAIKKDLKNFDLVHLHFPFYGAAEWVLASGVPYVITYHMDARPNKSYQKIVSSIYDRVVTPLIFQRARKIIVVDNNYQYKRNIINSEKRVFIPNGINTEIFKPVSLTPFQIGLEKLQGKKVFLFVGNLIPVKGISFLLRAWKELDSNYHLLIVGGGYNENIYKKEAKSIGVESRVHWLGACFDEKRLAQYYNICDAVVIPSSAESFSLVAGEALACGKPIVASNISGIKERALENETGFLFEKGSVEDFKNAIKKLIALSNNDLLNIQKNCRKLIENKFSLQTHVNSLEQLYSKI